MYKPNYNVYIYMHIYIRYTYKCYKHSRSAVHILPPTEVRQLIQELICRGK